MQTQYSLCYVSALQLWLYGRVILSALVGVFGSDGGLIETGKLHTLQVERHGLHLLTPLVHSRALSANIVLDTNSAEFMHRFLQKSTGKYPVYFLTNSGIY
jgi:hypothetical protein